MDDLMAKLQEILGSSEGQENLKKIAQMVGGEEGSDLSSGISSLFGSDKKEPKPETPDLGGLDLNALLKIQSLLQNNRQDDKNAALIRALRPHLKEERRHRADEALRLIRLFSLLPLLRESGLLGNLFGGDG